MNIELWIAFVAASSVLLIIPGPTILTVISYSISHGHRVKLPLIVAVALGDSTALVLSLLGLGGLVGTVSLLVPDSEMDWWTVFAIPRPQTNLGRLSVIRYHFRQRRQRFWLEAFRQYLSGHRTKSERHRLLHCLPAAVYFPRLRGELSALDSCHNLCCASRIQCHAIRPVCRTSSNTIIV